MKTNLRMISCAITICFMAICVRAHAQFNSDFFSGSVRPALENQRLAEQSSRRGVQLARKQKARAQVEALLVSINDYRGAAGLTSLQGCNNDIRMMKEWLEKDGVSPEAIEVFSDDSKLSNQLPELELLQQALKQKAKSNCERLIVVFACHGISAGGKSFICPLNVTSTDFENLDDRDEKSILKEGTQKNLLAVSSILSILKKSQAKEVLLILDACRNSSEEESFMREFVTLLNENDQNFRKTDGGSFVVLTGCSSGQSALEIYAKDGTAHGAFLYYFIDGLSGRADYAACYDGTVSLVEAYNYAYSRVSDEAQRRNRSQTPEIFMSSSNGNMTLASYSAPPAMDNETDIQFLMRIGIILADNRWKAKDNAVAVQALDCVLANVPNNALAYALRGSVRRKLGEYEGALADLEQIGEKFQLFVKCDEGSPLTLQKSKDDKEGQRQDGTKVENNALVTIAAMDGDYFLVSEVNNEAIGDHSEWIHRDNVTWSRVQANETITATGMQQSARVVGSAPPVNMLTPGNIIGGGGTVSAPGPVYH